MEFSLYMRHIAEDFFQQAEDHVQALKSALLKIPKRTTYIRAYVSFCDHFLRTLILEPWEAMSAVVAAAEQDDWVAVARAAGRWSPQPRSVSTLLQPVVDSHWALMAQRAAAVVVDPSVEAVVLGADVDPDQFQHFMTPAVESSLRRRWPPITACRAY